VGVVAGVGLAVSTAVGTFVSMVVGVIEAKVGSVTSTD
jgi:hypothetical protein